MPARDVVNYKEIKQPADAEITQNGRLTLQGG
jgi:hypothetical protein